MPMQPYVHMRRRLHAIPNASNINCNMTNRCPLLPAYKVQKCSRLHTRDIAGKPAYQCLVQ